MIRDDKIKNPNFNKERFGKFFDEEGVLIPEMEKEYLDEIRKEREEKEIKPRKTIREELNLEIEDKAREAVNPAYAGAMRELKKGNERRKSKIDADLDNVKNKNFTLDNVKKIQLEESLFEDWNEIDINKERELSVDDYLEDVKRGHGWVEVDKIQMDIENGGYHCNVQDVLNRAAEKGWKFDYRPEGLVIYAMKASVNESLFEDKISDYVVVVYKDDSELFEYADEYKADAHFAELNEMTDEDLLSKGILGTFRLMRDDEGKVFKSDVRYVDGEGISTKIDQIIAEYIGRANDNDFDEFED